MIHKYKFKDLYIVIDVNSGSVFNVDELVYKLLDYFPDLDEDLAVKTLTPNFSKHDILEAISEIQQLISEDVLFSREYSVNSDFTNNSTIKAMCLHVCHDCNMRCRYCFASQGDFKGQRLLMDKSTGKKAIDFLIANSRGRRNLEVDFFGGEPLLNLSLVKYLVEYARSKEKEYNKNFRFTITTNGLLLDDDTIDYLDENMNNVVMSIDGRREVNDRMRYTENNTGTYDIIMDKIKKMADRRGDKDHYVRGTYTKYNLDFSDDVLHLADCGFKSISVEPVVTDPNNDYSINETDLPVIFEEYEKLAEEYLKRRESKPFNFFHFNVDLSSGPCLYKRVSGCGSGNDYVAITPQGDIYPCHQFVGEEKFKLGDLDNGIVNKSLQSEFLKANLTEKENCKGCWAKYFCGGGCLANAYYTSGSILNPDEIGCELEKKRLECAIGIKVYEREKNADQE